jgi:hypothetical protein
VRAAVLAAGEDHNGGTSAGRGSPTPAAAHSPAKRAEEERETRVGLGVRLPSALLVICSETTALLSPKSRLNYATDCGQLRDLVANQFAAARCTANLPSLAAFVKRQCLCG